MLVDVSELIDYMDIKFSPRQTRAAEYVLSGLQSELEAYLRRSIELETVTENHVIPGDYMMLSSTSFFYDTTLDTTYTTTATTLNPPVTVYLRNTPVQEVTAVYLSKAGSASATATAQVEGTDYIVRRYGIDLINAMPNDNVTVSYTGGLPGDQINVFRLLILRAASREMQNMHDDVVGLKDLETRNVAPLTTGFTELELKSVKRWRHHKIGG